MKRKMKMKKEMMDCHSLLETNGEKGNQKSMIHYLNYVHLVKDQNKQEDVLKTT